MAQTLRQRGLIFSLLRRKLYVLTNGLCNALDLSCRMLIAKIMGKKTFVLHCAATQFMHIESVVRELFVSSGIKRIRIFFLTSPADITALRTQIEPIAQSPLVRSELAARFLLFCDFLLSVNQGMIFPYIGCKIRACCFHGQPSKGNVYEYFNYKRLNTLFFYGPLMRNHYLEHKERHPNWPEVDYNEVGQPKSDALFQDRIDRGKSRNQIGLDGSLFTVLFAPSFEYCSSFAAHGKEIIEALLDLEINLIVKPHPAFYNIAKFRDDFNQDVPHIREWRERVQTYDSHANCIFSIDNSLDAAAALAAADVMLTDYSGIAFDGILLDMGMIYWDCPLLYTEYLPHRFGIDGDRAKNDLACNVGRDAGIVVSDTDELANAIAVYRDNPQHMAPERKQIREQLLFNPGCATKAMARKIEELIGV